MIYIGYMFVLFYQCALLNSRIADENGLRYKNVGEVYYPEAYLSGCFHETYSVCSS